MVGGGRDALLYCGDIRAPRFVLIEPSALVSAQGDVGRAGLTVESAWAKAHPTKMTRKDGSERWVEMGGCGRVDPNVFDAVE